MNPNNIRGTMNANQTPHCLNRTGQGDCLKIAVLRAEGMLSPSIFYALTLANAKQCAAQLQNACKHFEDERETKQVAQVR